DNVLGYIPFEVLMPHTPEGDFNDFPFLLKKYEIRYSYLASLFIEPPKFHPDQKENSFVAFAPVFGDQNKTNFLVKSCERFYDGTQPQRQTRAFTRDGRYITPLPGTETEVKSIARLMGNDLFTKYFIFKDAREEVLKSDEMKQY